MAQPVGALRVDLSASSAKFQADMKKAKGAVKTNATGMQRAMSKVSKSFTQAATALNRYAGFAMVAAAAAAAVFIKKQIDIADKMGKLAQATGTTSEYLSSMALVASQGGTTLEVVAKGVKKLSQNMDDVRRGTGEAREAFEDLNIKVTDSAGVLRDSDKVMLDIADRFGSLEDGAEKTAYAMAIFGRAGGDLIPMLNGGSKGIKDLQEKAEELGLVISTKTALEAAILNDKLDILAKTASGWGRTKALGLIKWFNEAHDVIKLANKESGAFMATVVAFGALGDALFTKSLQTKIDDTSDKLERLKKIAKGDDGGEGAGLDIIGFGVTETEIKKLEEELAKLEAQKARSEKAEKDWMEAAKKRVDEKAEFLRKETEGVRTLAQAKIDAALAEKTAADEAKTAQEARWAADIATYEAVQQMMADIAEGVKLTEKSFEDLSEAGKKDLDDLADTGKTAMETLTDAVNNFGAQSSQAMTDFALHGESSFSDMIDSMIEDLIRMMIQEQIMGPMFKGISLGIGKLFPSANGNAFQGGSVIPFAKGGVITKPTIFPMAQGAGLVGEAGVEAAMPLTRMANGNLGVESSGGGGMQVNIYNTTGDSVETKQGTTADGIPTLEVMIGQAVSKQLGKFGSPADKSMRQNYGASRRLTRR